MSRQQCTSPSQFRRLCSPPRGAASGMFYALHGTSSCQQNSRSTCNVPQQTCPRPPPLHICTPVVSTCPATRTVCPRKQQEQRMQKLLLPDTKPVSPTKKCKAKGKKKKGGRKSNGVCPAAVCPGALGPGGMGPVGMGPGGMGPGGWGPGRMGPGGVAPGGWSPGGMGPGGMGPGGMGPGGWGPGGMAPGGWGPGGMSPGGMGPGGWSPGGMGPGGMGPGGMGPGGMGPGGMGRGGMGPRGMGPEGMSPGDWGPGGMGPGGWSPGGMGPSGMGSGGWGPGGWGPGGVYSGGVGADGKGTDGEDGLGTCPGEEGCPPMAIKKSLKCLQSQGMTVEQSLQDLRRRTQGTPLEKSVVALHRKIREGASFDKSLQTLCPPKKEPACRPVLSCSCEQSRVSSVTSCCDLEEAVADQDSLTCTCSPSQLELLQQGLEAVFPPCLTDCNIPPPPALTIQQGPRAMLLLPYNRCPNHGTQRMLLIPYTTACPNHTRTKCFRAPVHPQSGLQQISVLQPQSKTCQVTIGGTSIKTFHSRTRSPACREQPSCSPITVSPVVLRKRPDPVQHARSNPNDTLPCTSRFSWCDR